MKMKTFVFPVSDVTWAFVSVCTFILLSDMCLYYSFQKHLEYFFLLFCISGC